ncbi:hypothetical protein NVP1087A_26 [Vibrio phage 1.087.A._10N.261.45.F9]|nr:hypothetical protein NVP1087A_26 [Vibrio phage 1.087.A._10N.261.45.F9]
MKLTDISNSKAKEIINGAPKEATHFSCIEGKVQYYKGEETVISSFDGVFINVFRDIFQPSIFPLSDLENQMNIDKVETQTEHQEEMSAFSGEVEWKNGDECVVINDNNRYSVYDEHKKHLGTIGIIRSLFKTKNGTEMAAVQAENGDCICWRVVMLSKPETPQQREDRERLEAAYDLYTHVQSVRGQLSCKFDWFSNSEMEEARLRFLAIVDKTNYRKESN